MYRRILVPIDLSDVELAKPAIATALMMAKESNGSVRLINVLPVTPVMLAEYVPPDFEAQQRVSAEEAIAIVARETGLAPDKMSTAVLQGNVDREILDEAKRMRADLIVMSSHRTGVRTYFLGSHGGHVVRYAACSVLVVRQQAGERRWQWLRRQIGSTRGTHGRRRKCCRGLEHCRRGDGRRHCAAVSPAGSDLGGGRRRLADRVRPI